MPDEFEILSQHVVSTLPTDVHVRRAILNSLLVHSPREHRRTPEIRTMLGNLDQHLVMQREFTLQETGGGK